MVNIRSMPTVLQSIVDKRKTHLDSIRRRIANISIDDLSRSSRSLKKALAGKNRFILECKSASPSRGIMRGDYHPGELARVYSRYAAAISVLCEPEHFHGDYDHLLTVAESTHLPVLCKDFIVDEVQVLAARYFGADAILLMLSVLDDEEYEKLARVAQRLGLDILTETVNKEEMRRASRLGAEIIGINHRNLHDLSIDLTRSQRLAALAPAGTVVIAESGITNHRTVTSLGTYVNGFLVGSQLTSQPDVDRAARTLIYGHNKVCGLTSPTAAQAARAAGAVYGGLIVAEDSPRYVSRETSAAIMRAEPDLTYVGVSRSHCGYDKLAQLGVGAVQVHAPLSDTWEMEKQLIKDVRAQVSCARNTDRDNEKHSDDRIAIWRALPLDEPRARDYATAYVDTGLVDRLVLDNSVGGTGRSFDWTAIPETVPSHSLLAGGLHHAVLTDALSVGCLGLDLNTGMEYGSAAGQAWAHMKNTAAIHDAFTTIRAFYDESKERSARPTHKDMPHE